MGHVLWDFLFCIHACVLHSMLQIGPELGIIHGSFLLLTRLFLLSLRQHPRYLGTGGKKGMFVSQLILSSLEQHVGVGAAQVSGQSEG